MRRAQRPSSFMHETRTAIRALLLCFTAALSACSRAPEPIPSLIPAPARLEVDRGHFRVTGSTPVLFTGGNASEQTALYFIDLVRRTHRISLPVAMQEEAAGATAIRFELSADEGTAGAEDYSLHVSPKRIVVSSRSPRGLFYGAVTLWQLLGTQVAADEIRVPALGITDAPRFRWRGLMLDSARHYQSPQFIKTFIDAMALHKLNVLHWHLTDDQGWRLEIRKYPKLTEVGAWRVPAGPAAAADLDGATGQPRRYGGYYTQEQVRDIVAYAAARHITIVPEIEMPGHASAAIAAYPQLAAIDNPPDAVPADWGVYPNLFNIEDSTFAFLEDVLSEVIELFPGEYIHVGGDEAVKDQWRASARVQSRMRELGIADEHALQSWFVQRIGKFLSTRGRRLVGWDEVLEGGLAPDATVMSWRGIDGALAAATAGHDAVLAPAPTLYLDNRPFDAAIPGRGLIVSVEDVYRFDPAPAAFEPAQLRHILGVQANLWTEHIRSEQRVEEMAFPRAAAIAEVGWSPSGRLDWKSFSQRLPEQLARYELLGIEYGSQSQPVTPTADLRTSHQLQLCSKDLVLSLEDDAPVRQKRAVFLVDIMNPCWIYPQVDLSGGVALIAAVGSVPFNFQIGNDVQRIPLRKPATTAGELEIRKDRCDGELLAAIPLDPAVANSAVTRLPPARLEASAGKHDVCLIFTRATVDPIWVLDTVELARE